MPCVFFLREIPNETHLLHNNVGSHALLDFVGANQPKAREKGAE
jgi:hypothetical protein